MALLNSVINTALAMKMKMMTMTTTESTTLSTLTLPIPRRTLLSQLSSQTMRILLPVGFNKVFFINPRHLLNQPEPPLINDLWLMQKTCWAMMMRVPMVLLILSSTQAGITTQAMKMIMSSATEQESHSALQGQLKNLQDSALKLL